jgi:hypothetical protein
MLPGAEHRLLSGVFGRSRIQDATSLVKGEGAQPKPIPFEGCGSASA